LGHAPEYLLVMPYATVELFLHPKEHFLRSVYLGLCFLSVSLSARVLLWCVVFLPDIQQVRSQLLQLTAGNGHQEDVKTGKSEEVWEAAGGHEELLHRDSTCKVRCEV
jgi:hypothetical protein